MTVKVTNIKQFNADLERFADKIGLGMQDVIDKTTLDLFKDIVERTPVDLGYARANWFINPDTPNTDTIDPKSDKNINYKSENSKQEGKINGSQSYYITNNLPYIVTLEEGNSKQSGMGHMVKRSVSKAQQEIKDLLKGLDK